MRDLSMGISMRFSLFRGLAVLMICALAHEGANAAISAADYRSSLLQILGRYEGVVALRDACNGAFPQTKAANDKAFNAWQVRHKKLIGELDERFAMMIRAYSKDDKDYARNFGKYQGALLRQREEVKQAHLLESRGELDSQCKGLPEFLQGKDSDIESEFANEILILRQWKLPSK